MKVNVLELREGENFLEFRETVASLDMGSLSTALSSEVLVKLKLHKHENEIIVWGTSSLTVTEECSRCLESFDREFDVQFEAFCDKIGTRKGEERSGEVEGETFTVYHDGKILDLRPCLREAIVLSLPIKPLCKENCNGLCPICGKNLNDGACNCPRDKTGARWSILERLNKEKEN
ncbi:MAG: DUF177 domain-containing protein [Candidatus Eisenbacteria bacterium]|nr:DUF177 domain-containing protein [Candidatus Eisenbacteria bacterium]